MVFFKISFLFLFVFSLTLLSFSKKQNFHIKKENIMIAKMSDSCLNKIEMSIKDMLNLKGLTLSKYVFKHSSYLHLTDKKAKTLLHNDNVWVDDKIFLLQRIDDKIFISLVDSNNRVLKTRELKCNLESFDYK